jgi:hypothetical protein
MSSVRMVNFWGGKATEPCSLAVSFTTIIILSRHKAILLQYNGSQQQTLPDYASSFRWPLAEINSRVVYNINDTPNQIATRSQKELSI